MARLVAYSTVGVPPEIMGIGPVPAIQNVLKVSGLSLNDIDLIEVHISLTKLISLSINLISTLIGVMFNKRIDIFTYQID